MKQTILFLAVITAMRLFLAGSLELIPDEAYYWTWSRELHAGYLDHPPMVAVFIAAATWLGGTSELGVRLAAIIPGLGFSLLAYRLGKEVFQDAATGRQAVFWVNVVPLFAAGSVFATPDSPLLFFHALALCGFFRAVFLREAAGWLWCGAALGLALASKYTGVLIVPALGLFLIFSREHGFWLRRKEPYLALLLAGIVFSPVFLWNATHAWASFKFQWAHGTSADAVKPFAGFSQYLGAQIALLTPFVFAAMITALACCYRLWNIKNNERYLFLFTTSAPIFLFFLVISFKNKVQGNWAAPAYFTATLALAGFFGAAAADLPIRVKKTLHFLKIAAMITVIPVLVAAHGYTLFRALPLPAQADALADRTLGWKQLGLYLAPYFHERSEETFVFSDQHTLASEITFYLPGRPVVYRTGGKHRYPYLPGAEFLVGKNGLYVFEEGRGDVDVVAAHFDAMTELPPLIIETHGKIIRVFRLFRCANYRGGLIET